MHSELFPITDSFLNRHVGPSEQEIQEMLESLGFNHIDELISKAVPNTIRLKSPLKLKNTAARGGDGDLAPTSEFEALRDLHTLAQQNQVYRSFIGMGYAACITPPVIQRGILENPGWYTQYTPYQAEIAQGRLEALFNFQTLVTELAGLHVANSSLLDEGTAAAEAMSLAHRTNRKSSSNVLFVSKDCHPQTIDVVQNRARPLGIELVIGDHREFDFSTDVFAVMVNYPTSEGFVLDYAEFFERAHAKNATTIVCADLLALVALKSPGSFGADIAVGSSQRFGVPLGFGGPHAAYMACKDDFKRQIPGRIIGQTVDADGNPALRLALQTREQHIRREKATSNICTAQVLLAVIASMYACYHGPEGLRAIVKRIHLMTQALEAGLEKLGFEANEAPYFDTLKVATGSKTKAILEAANAHQINLRSIDENHLGVTLDEATRASDILTLLNVFAGGAPGFALEDVNSAKPILADFWREDAILTQECFNRYHSETELLRYMAKLQGRDLSLTTSMIPLGSCTMKLNAAAEMFPITWKEFGQIHPFVPSEQVSGYHKMFEDLEEWLAVLTGMDATSLQPNAGSQGEYAGMLVIQEYFAKRGEAHRNVCLIPSSAHGTNPASAIMAGMKVVVIACDENGNIDLDDLRKKAAEHAEHLAALMVTYPSTHGVFETEIQAICEVVHEHGGQVYMDGANMNAQVGLCTPGGIGADVCHLNLHKTFCIPHGGGGPGMGPICVKQHLAEFLPSHPVVKMGGEKSSGAISAAPWGSASILAIPWMYIRMLAAEGLTHATKVAILNANYMAARLHPYFPVLYRGAEGQVAHEFILDMRGTKHAGLEVVDFAKRLMDYGYHAPTMSWPVAGTMMVEPTESESKTELDRFCDAIIGMHAEVEQITSGAWDQSDNPLKNAPHTMQMVCADEWSHGYSRQVAAFPASWSQDNKFWPFVRRVDDAYGDRNLVCACPPISEYE